MVKRAVVTVILVQLAMLAQVSVALPVKSEQTFERRASSDGVDSLLSRRDQMDLGARSPSPMLGKALLAGAAGLLLWHHEDKKEEQDQQKDADSDSDQDSKYDDSDKDKASKDNSESDSDKDSKEDENRKRSVDDIGKREWDEFEKRYWDHDLEERRWVGLEERGLGFDELD